MKPTNPQLRHRLIQELGKRQSNRKGSSGFTLIELLIVVIIVGILSAIALPAFLGQANRAKANAAKSLVSSLAKECQVSLVEGNTSFTPTVKGTTEVTLTPDGNCNGTSNYTGVASVQGRSDTYTVVINTSGAVSKTCAPGSIGCGSGNTW